MSNTTIAIAAFNAAETIEQCVRSAIAQTVPVAVLVADDGSDDETADRADSAGACVLRLPHGGRASAFNAAYRAADSPYVAFLGADDWLDPGAIAALLGPLTRDCGIVMSYCDLAIHDRFGEPRGAVWDYRDETTDALRAHFRQSGQAPIPSSGGTLWRRDWLYNIDGFREDICADTDLLSRAVSVNGFRAVHVPGAHYHYRWSPHKVMSREKAEVTVRIMKRHGAQREDFERKWYSWGCSSAAGPFFEAMS